MISRLQPLRAAAICALIAMALSLFVFSPRLWLMRTYRPGTFQWDRAHTYLLQCEHPLRRDVEPAMLWRLLPPLVAHAADLRGPAAFALPWAGVLVAVGYVALLCRRRCSDWRFMGGVALLFSTSSAVLAPAHWLGLNDAWVWFALLATAFGDSSWVVPAAALLGPWVDERFVIGFPLALAVRAADREAPLRTAALSLLWLAPYAAVRFAFLADPMCGSATVGFLRTQWAIAARTATWAPLGWWMGWRAGWVAIGYGGRLRPILFAIAGGGALVLSALLAADTSRSAAILAPLALFGAFEYLRREPKRAPRAALVIGLLNLLIPAAHVTFDKFDLVNPLPVELLRLWYSS